MEVNRHEILEQRMCKELDILEEKYRNSSTEMSIQDLEKLDKLYHTLKSKVTYEAMMEAKDYEMDGMSGRRGHNPVNSQYISRTQDYADGYAKGYSEAMNQNASGHYPPTMPMYTPRY